MALNEQPKGKLNLNGILVPLRIGVSDEERSVPQPIRIDIGISWRSIPPACESDRIQDTICYANLIHELREFLRPKTYHLLEKLGFDIYNLLRKSLPASVALQLKVRKERAPIPEVDEIGFEIDDHTWTREQSRQ